MAKEAVTRKHLSEGTHPLEYIFHPRAIAVLGASPPAGPGVMGDRFVRSFQAMGFRGPLYPVNPKYQEIADLKCYPTLLDIPGPVDHVLSSVPAHVVPQLLDDCVAKGVKTIHLFTAGFSETGEEERTELEKLVLAKTRSAGIRIIGPNCMGVYCPSTGLTWSSDFPKEPGPVALISQSGTIAGRFINHGSLRGLRFSKVISYGNAADLNEADFIDYCAHDPQTEVIACYIEGVRDGRRFFRALQEAAGRKPVVILKAGRSEAGGRAANSHTGSLAGSLAIFDALCRQVGAVQVESIDELLDMMVAVRFLKAVPGRGLGVVGGGGGLAVLAADEIASVGLEVPPMPPALQDELHRFIPVAGGSARNPIDSNSLWESPANLRETLCLVARAPLVDILLHFMPDWARLSGGEEASQGHLRGWIEALCKVREMTAKPVVVILQYPPSAEGAAAMLRYQERCVQEGFAVFPTVLRAAKAIARLLAWQENYLQA